MSTCMPRLVDQLLEKKLKGKGAVLIQGMQIAYTEIARDPADAHSETDEAAGQI